MSKEELRKKQTHNGMPGALLAPDSRHNSALIEP
jgi:hypothetical protein